MPKPPGTCSRSARLARQGASGTRRRRRRSRCVPTAWSLREVVEAASANPDGSAMKAYFTQIAANTIQYLLSQLPTWTAQEGQLAGWFPDPQLEEPRGDDAVRAGHAGDDAGPRRRARHSRCRAASGLADQLHRRPVHQRRQRLRPAERRAVPTPGGRSQQRPGLHHLGAGAGRQRGAGDCSPPRRACPRMPNTRHWRRRRSPTASPIPARRRRSRPMAGSWRTRRRPTPAICRARRRTTSCPASPTGSC